MLISQANQEDIVGVHSVIHMYTHVVQGESGNINLTLREEPKMERKTWKV